MAISGKLWPLHPKPQQDELLSSWIVRIARANSIILHTFCDTEWRKKPIWNRDIDKSASEDILTVLSNKSGTPLCRAYQTTLKSYEGYLYEKHNPLGHTKWIMPIGVYHRVRRRFGLQCCPMCLAEDKDPYYRKKWRLAFITICEKHKCQLIDRCPECGYPICFHRSRIEDEFITFCAKCHIDFRSAIVCSKLHPDLLDYQAYLIDILEKGFFILEENKPIYSHLYFDTFHQLMHLLSMAKKTKRLRDYIYSQIDYGEQINLPETPQVCSFEFLGIKERACLTVMVCWLLSCWPDRFVNVCKKTNFLSAGLLKDMSIIPFWFWIAIYNNLCKNSYSPSDEEIRSITAILKRKNETLTVRRISDFLGVNNVFRKRKSKIDLFIGNGLL